MWAKGMMPTLHSVHPPLTLARFEHRQTLGRVQSADFGNMGSMGGGGQEANFQAMESIAKAGFGVYGEKLYGKGQSFMHKYLPGKATLYPYLNINNRCAWWLAAHSPPLPGTLWTSRVRQWSGTPNPTTTLHAQVRGE